MKQYFVYVMASTSRSIYIGITENLERRVWEHKTGAHDGHSKRYRQTHLVYIETFQWVTDAIAREKQLKTWNRQKKVRLIERENPSWQDLSNDWCVDA